MKKKQNIYEMDETHKEEETQPLLSKSGSVCKTVYAIVIMVVLQMSYIMATISVQVSGIQSNIFQVTSLKFILQCLGITPAVFHGNFSLRLHKSDIYLVVVAGSMNVIFGSTFFLAASFMPVGNLDGLGVAFYILFSASYDFYKKSITKRSVVISCLVIVGILLVVQPWSSQVEQNTIHLSPCQVLDSGLSKINGSLPFQTSGNNSIDVDSLENHGGHSLWLGYIFIIIAFIAMTIEGNTDRLLLNEYPLPVVMFWLTLCEGWLSFVMNLIWTGVNHQDIYTIPSGRYCVIFLCSFVIFSSTSRTLSVLVYKYWHISSVALSNVVLTVSLYVSQRTFLSDFHPGHANVTELIGIAIITFSVTVLPFIFILVDKHKQ